MSTPPAASTPIAIRRGCAQGRIKPLVSRPDDGGGGTQALEQTDTHRQRITAATRLRDQTDHTTNRGSVAQSAQLLTENSGTLHTATTVAATRRLLRSISERTAAAAAAAETTEAAIIDATSPPKPTAGSPLRHNGKVEGSPTVVTTPRRVLMDEERTRQQDSPRPDGNAGRDVWLWRLTWIVMRGVLMASGVAATQHCWPLLRQWLQTRSGEPRAGMGPREGWRTARSVVAAAASRGVESCARGAGQVRRWLFRRAASVVGGVCVVGASICHVGNAARGLCVRFAKEGALGAWHAVMLFRRMVRRRTVVATKAWRAGTRRSRRPKQVRVDSD